VSRDNDLVQDTYYLKVLKKHLGLFLGVYIRERSKKNNKGVTYFLINSPQASSKV
jgi:hypothetical protein